MGLGVSKITPCPPQYFVVLDELIVQDGAELVIENNAELAIVDTISGTGSMTIETGSVIRITI